MMNERKRWSDLEELSEEEDDEGCGDCLKELTVEIDCSEVDRSRRSITYRFELSDCPIPGATSSSSSAASIRQISNSNVMAASTSVAFRLEPPDRRQFELDISLLTNDIRAKEQELKSLLGYRPSIGSILASASTSTTTTSVVAAAHHHIPGLIARSREDRQRCRREREEHKKTVAHLQRRVDELKTKLTTKRNEISLVEENSLLFKNEQKLSDQLRRYQSLYDNKQFTNIREETAIVQQIDKLTRNQKQLKRWKAMCDERDKLETDWKSARTQLQAVFGNIRESRRMEEGHKEMYKQRVQAVTATKKELNESYNQKRRLIQDYNEKRQSFLDWRRTHPAEAAAAAANNVERSNAASSNRRPIPSKLKRKASGIHPGSYGSTRYGSSAMGDDSDSDSDGGTDFELFWEEKRACRNLISYLQRIAQQSTSTITTTTTMAMATLCLTPSTGSTESEQNHAVLSNASSLTEDPHFSVIDSHADDPNGNLIMLRKDSGDEAAAEASHPARRKASKKDKARKPHQAMTYDSQTFSRFDSIGVNAPLTVSDVPVAIENLRDKLKYYEDQTRLPPDTTAANYWYETFGIPTQAERMISSESEMTTDSARYSLMTPSDADDSFSTTGGLQSPVAYSYNNDNDSPSMAALDGRRQSSTTFANMAGRLSFATSMETDESSLAATPLAAAAGSLSFPPQDQDKTTTMVLSRIPTCDEGIADLASDTVSKHSSAGDSNCDESVVQIRNELGRLESGKANN